VIDADAEGHGSRIVTVLASDFAEGIESLPLDELRRRRDAVLGEREFQSYFRRLIQVREDILRNERERRRQGTEQQPLVERLTSVLAEGPQSRGRGEAPRFHLPAEDAAEAERRAERVVPDTYLGDPSSLTDEGLDEALDALAAEERIVSADRAAVIRIHDRLQEELKRRYREDPSQITRDT
jgi:hypothetical protein